MEEKHVLCIRTVFNASPLPVSFFSFSPQPRSTSLQGVPDQECRSLHHEDEDKVGHFNPFLYSLPPPTTSALELSLYLYISMSNLYHIERSQYLDSLFLYLVLLV